jgi:hypothetical protein
MFFPPDNATGCQQPSPSPRKLASGASRTRFFGHLSIPGRYRNRYHGLTRARRFVPGELRENLMKESMAYFNAEIRAKADCGDSTADSNTANQWEDSRLHSVASAAGYKFNRPNDPTRTRATLIGPKFCTSQSERESHGGGYLDMPMQRYKPEQIVTVLRQIEVAVANGKTTPQACKEAGITVQG